VSLGRERRWWLGERAQWQGGDGVSPNGGRILASGCVVTQPPGSAAWRREASGTESLHCGSSEETARWVVFNPSPPGVGLGVARRHPLLNSRALYLTRVYFAVGLEGFLFLHGREHAGIGRRGGHGIPTGGGTALRFCCALGHRIGTEAPKKLKAASCLSFLGSSQGHLRGIEVG
jgi:hypothetical protein